jgi:hypothetical protein
VNQVGDPYRYGASEPHAFDCSGLVHYSFRKAGFSRIPRISRAQAGFTRRLMVHSPSGGRRVHKAHPWTSSWFPGTLRHR